MVTVVIPTFNRAKVIERAINSVLSQTYTDLELLVIDDCSTDDTKDIISSIKDKRLKYFCLPHNSGACAARNKGIELAAGEYIAFQDSDDEWLPEKLEKQLQILMQKNADLVFCCFEKIFSDGTRMCIPSREKSGFCTQKELLYESMASTQTIIGKTEVIKAIRFDESMPRMQDYDFIIRASESYKVYLLNQTLVNVFEQPDSITASKRQYEKRLEITNKLLSKYNSLCVKYPEWHIKMLKIVAHCQVMLKEDASYTLRMIFHQEQTMANLMKIYIYKCGMLYLMFKWKEWHI